MEYDKFSDLVLHWLQTKVVNTRKTVASEVKQLLFPRLWKEISYHKKARLCVFQCLQMCHCDLYRLLRSVWIVKSCRIQWTGHSDGAR